MDQLFTIGALAERCGLSRSALRFYDQCGLLRPVLVDGATGYRYYDQGQAGEAELVRRLRAAEVPVEDVRAFLAAAPMSARSCLVHTGPRWKHAWCQPRPQKGPSCRYCRARDDPTHGPTRAGGEVAERTG